MRTHLSALGIFYFYNMSFERPSAEEPKESANAEREREEHLQEVIDLGQMENWLKGYITKHYPAKNEEAPTLTLGDVLMETRKRVRAKRDNPKNILDDLKRFTQLNHALPNSKRLSPTMEMTIAPENTHEHLSERSLSVELKKDMTIEEALKILAERKEELVAQFSRRNPITHAT